jgi:S-adenosylmethionine:tRNA ribosyltransferase-isomerase
MAMDELSEYDFYLPRTSIAQHPLPCRTDARLLRLNRGSGGIQEAHIRDLPSVLRAGDALVFNDTRVVPARLSGTRAMTGGSWQGLFLRLSPGQPAVWEIMSKTRGAMRPGELVTLRDREGREGLQLEVLAKLEGGNLAVRPTESRDLTEILEQYGQIPLPPYIRDGRMVDSDIKDYQTVFARHNGSVAAPTAGLHFTTELLNRLQDRGISTHWVTLHVGIGTFRPIKVEQLDQHDMHAEWGRLDESTAKQLQAVRDAGGRVIAVGTTSVRVLETAMAGRDSFAPWSGETNLFIRPGYSFRAIDALLTNFHLPRSSLLVLVSALAGRKNILNAYEYAVAQGYRFFSYGDAMLIE